MRPSGECCNLECLTCTGTTRTDCASCDAALFLSTENTCCHPSCLTCTGPATNQCVLCNDGFYNNGGTCDACDISCSTCTGVTNANCLTCNGALGYQMDPITNTCLLCHPTCQTCNQANDPYDCTSCYTPNILDPVAKNCYFKCPAQTYKPSPVDPLSTACSNCHTTCQTCTGPNNTDCTSCPDSSPLQDSTSATVYQDSGSVSGVFFSKGKCVTACASGSYYNGATSLCESCSSNCITCRDTLNCYSCSSSRQLHQFDENNANCRPWCAPNQYRENSLAGTCLSCHPACNSCVGPTYRECVGSGCAPTFEKLNLNT